MSSVNFTNLSDQIGKSFLSIEQPFSKAELSIDTYVAKMKAQVECGNLKEAVAILKEAKAETQQQYLVILEKYWTETSEISAAHSVQRGNWCMLLASDPDLKDDAKILLTNAVREFNLAFNQKSESAAWEKEFCVEVSKMLITSYLELIRLEISDGNIEDARACFKLGRECCNYLKEQEPKTSGLGELEINLWIAEVAIITLERFTK